MTQEQQLSAFADDLDALVARYQSEWSITAAVFVGVLEIKKHALIKQAFEEEEE
jgi:hypothetical protein